MAGLWRDRVVRGSQQPWRLSDERPLTIRRNESVLLLWLRRALTLGIWWK